MKTQKKIKDLVCPFCSLHCDDIQVSISGNRFKVNNKNLICTKKIEKSNIKSSSQILPEINSKTSTLSDALKAIKKKLSDHKEILLLNHGVDLSGLRSMLSFATKYNCIIDHINSKTLFQNLNLMQRSGYMATSLTEIKNRADIIIVFGNKIFEKSPRLLEKVLQSKNSLCTDVKKKEIILIGNFNSSTFKHIKNNSKVTNIKLDLDKIPSLMKLLISNEAVENLEVLSKTDLNRIKKLISKSKYLVATWTNSDFSAAKNPEMIINAISKYIISYNIKKRGACAPIAGSLGDITSSQALAWMTGFASRIKFTGTTFQHDRISYDSNILIENNNVDVIVHISTLNLNKIKLNKNIYNIVIGHPNSVFDHKPDIFIPVGVPGVDYDGIMFRTDNVVSVALKNIRDIKLPTTENIINKLS
ncbi:MAG: hypothetical protein VX890_02925 [Pseudomonadota bacterium]|nr:hypothetical protein [Pseudomonadota bacterium]